MFPPAAQTTDSESIYVSFVAEGMTSVCYIITSNLRTPMPRLYDFSARHDKVTLLVAVMKLLNAGTSYKEACLLSGACGVLARQVDQEHTSTLLRRKVAEQAGNRIGVWRPC